MNPQNEAIDPDHKKKRTNLSRAKADQLLAELVERAKQVNRGPFAWRIERMEVFGSYMTDKEKLGDLDIAVELAPRYPNEGPGEPQWLSAKQKEANKQRIRLALNNGRRFPNFLLEFCWPQEEVMRVLKNRSRALSFTDTQDLDILSKHSPKTTRRRVIFERRKEDSDGNS